jgi:protein gp37
VGKETHIQWTNYTWSPWLGCRKVSPCCDNCYISETPALRFRGLKHGKDRIRTSESYWREPLVWNKKAAAFQMRQYAEGLEPSRPRVFPSLCDPFDFEVPDHWREDFFGLMGATQNLDWLLLTKRPKNTAQIVIVPLPNIWLGVSVGCQADADRWIPVLMSIPAQIRFLSVEPLLEQVDLKLEGIHWVIVGGESGRKARPCRVDWVRNVVNQCQEASVPCFLKQFGSNCIAGKCQGFPIQTKFTQSQMEADLKVVFNHPKGGDPCEWPLDLQEVRQFPQLAASKAAIQAVSDAIGGG